ncbi:hypothetical protein CCACVL1_22992 [Corchorus capsularis]|uniref:Uncharacterized protein n=1 Tax=Corchorus capsularis TaxID=210143 RepID=A0A1R3GVZ2_COCAP|nr:hypothetical protein CCACVL1_22992 [Corchorus capsularis]
MAPRGVHRSVGTEKADRPTC